MIHPHDILGARPLGDTGLFVGGFVSALELVEEGGAKPGDFKFFFNHLAWPRGALEEQVRQRNNIQDDRCVCLSGVKEHSLF